MRVPGVASRFPFALGFVFLFAVLWWFGRSSATTTVTISNTVETAGIDRPGINLGGSGNYGSQQLLKSLNYANGGYLPGTYCGSDVLLQQWGNSTRTTTWYNNITDASGYPANFWAGASYVAINAATGASYGSGTVTASTSNRLHRNHLHADPCYQRTMQSLAEGCADRASDGSERSLAPSQVLNKVCPGATWDTSDTSPSSTNTQHSLEMPTGCGLTFYIDATVHEPNKYERNSRLTAGELHQSEWLVQCDVQG